MAAIDESAGHALTIREAAAACRVSPRTIRRHLQEGHFPNAFEVNAPDAPGGTIWKIPVGDLEHAELEPRVVHPALRHNESAADAGGAAPTVLELVRSDRFGRLRSELAEAVAAAELALLRAEVERWKMLAEERGQALERADLALKALTNAMGTNARGNNAMGAGAMGPGAEHKEPPRDARPSYSEPAPVPQAVREEAMRYTATIQAMRELHTHQQRRWWQFWR